MQRAIKDLSQLPDSDLFDEVSTGISLIMESANRLDAAARKLVESGDNHAAQVIGNLAEEEAAKVLILIDAVRCPKSKQQERTRTLGFFYDHIAKGIYGDACSWNPAHFGEVSNNVESDREAYFLDGPNYVDWIFPNRFTQRREDDLYVGYVREDGGANSRYWTAPSNDQLFPYSTPQPILLVNALHQAGVTSSDSLEVVANIWRSFEPTTDTRFDEVERLNSHTLEKLAELNLLLSDDAEIVSLIIRRWPFPMWPLDLRRKEVSRADLQAIQREAIERP